MKPQEPDYMRLLIAIALAVGVLVIWQAKVEAPRRQALSKLTVETTEKRIESQAKAAEQLPVKSDAEDNPNLSHDERLALAPRITIRSEKLDGSISLKGARFDELKLVKYREEPATTSPEVELLSPNGDANSYFAQIGWLSQDGKTKVPDQHSVWQADKKTIGAGDTVNLKWNNGEGVTFTLAVTLDQDYMFSVAQHVENKGAQAVNVMPYAYINRSYEEPAQNYAALHQGPLGVMNGSLEEVAYKELREKGNKTYDDASGWFGITDKYWLSALIPGQPHYKATFSFYNKAGKDRYQVDYLGSAQTVEAGAGSDYSVRFFSGAKAVNLLDRYAAGDANHAPIPLFDRAIDFGWLYFLAKPMLLAITLFYAFAGNFGVAIMMLTILVKLLMYPLASKAFHATSQMRELQPQMLKIREKYFDDSITLNKEMMALYKREKINPASGCLPILLQMPVFFALYKVLMVSIEMRHAPFIGWIHDLSAMDPSNVFTLFGLIPWPTPAWLHLGILPMLMCLTMIIQMRQQPKPADPVQARMMTYMPYFMLLIFTKMPAGFVVYWTWSNTISIVQQRVISARHHAKMLKKAKKAA